VVAGAEGVRLVQNEPGEGEALLSVKQVLEVYAASREAESLFGGPQDVEWTFGPSGLHLLQSRPVTAGKQDSDEKRVWNLSLRRSFENLGELRRKIEGSILPGMREEADRLDEANLGELSEEDLAGEVQRRQDALDRWTGVYWLDLIPFAHGMRLFGQVYNDAVGPRDPFAFVALLRPDRLESVERNRLIRQMSDHIRQHPRLRERLRAGELAECGDAELLSGIDAYQRRYGNLLGIQADRRKLEDHLCTLLLEMSDSSGPLNAEQTIADRDQLEQEYLSRFEPKDRQRAVELLELGRASYRIRDDDNIYLDRFKGLLREAEELGRDRLKKRGVAQAGELPGQELVLALRDSTYRPGGVKKPMPEPGRYEVDARQLLGQPASHGIATGRARVVLRPEDLFSIRKGEILVCDAIDPAMTFVAPLVAGIVERRGGMLIHGAIIAREYGIPCVTGIPEATQRIASGDRLTVDGYLGIVVIAASRSAPDTARGAPG
jgi:phosphohistidine swiveling domain-containing protein